MAISQSTARAKRYAFWATALILFILWQLGSLSGALIGRAVDPADIGLDAAAPAVFLALLWPMLRQAEARWVALGGALQALVLMPIAPPGIPVLASGIVALIGGLLRTGQPVEQIHGRDPI